ncbi:MAG: metallophosphoesterase, partial [Planctomycetes bacterium]|nr:metallophosphoesterase [Planctomycetota bacterium]
MREWRLGRLFGVLLAIAGASVLFGFGPPGWAQPKDGLAQVRFGVMTDAHLLGGRTPQNEAFVRGFVAAMREWKPDFVIDLGDFACQPAEGRTTPALHDEQLRWLTRHWRAFSDVPCPAYAVLGNHDVGWIRGGDEAIGPEDLYSRSHGGEHVTKSEHLAVTKMPGRYYSFDVKGYHFIVLDGNNARGETAVAAGHDGVEGAYGIDEAQKAWLAKDLAAHREKPKVVFCHQELHHTPVSGSGEGGDAPFPPVGKEHSYVDNGWELRAMFSADGRVLACFFGHKHDNRWTVYGRTHYI